METEHKSDLIEVTVMYPSAHHPAERGFSPDTKIREIKAFALEAFGLKEEMVNGNQTVYFLFHGRTKIENLDQPLSDFVQGHERSVEFRLAKEIIAG